MIEKNIPFLSEAYEQLQKSMSALSDANLILWETKQYNALRKVITAQIRQLEAQRNIIRQIKMMQPLSVSDDLSDNAD